MELLLTISMCRRRGSVRTLDEGEGGGVVVVLLLKISMCDRQGGVRTL